MRTPIIKLIIADDHDVYRDGLRMLLRREKNISIVGEACDWHELLQLTTSTLPDVVLTDIKMPGMSGVQGVHQIKDRHPQTKVVVLSMVDDEDTIVEILNAGALGYLIKNADKSEIVEAIKTVCEDKPYICSVTATKLTPGNTRLHKVQVEEKVIFNKKQLAVIGHLCAGKSWKESGELTGITEKGVEYHLENIKKKLKVKKTAEVIAYAIKHRLHELKLETV